MIGQSYCDVCFLFGAGASADFGAPVMREFLSCSAEVAKSDEVAADDLRLLQRWREDAVKRCALCESSEGNETDLVPDASNLEDLLCLAEMDASSYDLRQRDVVDSLLRLTGRVYGESVRPTVDCMLGRLSRGEQPVLGYERLVSDLRALDKGNLWCARCSFLTMNYDLALDTAVAFTPSSGPPRHPGDVDCLPESAIGACAQEPQVGPLYWLGRSTDNEMQRSVPLLLKLHGSLNWGVCTDPACDAPVQQFPFFTHARHGSEAPRSHSAEQEMRSRACQYHPLPNDKRPKHRPYIVPPTWKQERHGYALRRIWTRAQLDLSSAARVVIVGHSLPATDSYLRHFLALGLTRTSDKRVLVVNPELDRYQAFLSTLLPKERCQFHAHCFAESVDRIVEFVSV